MINRLCNPLFSHSFFVFGARGTGKSTLMKQFQLPGQILFDLLDDTVRHHWEQVAEN